MVEGRPGGQTGNHMKSWLQPKIAKEVEQGIQEISDDPSAISNGLWQTGRDATEI